MSEVKRTENRHVLAMNRRHFVKKLAAGGAILTFGWSEWPAFAESRPRTPATLSGTHFDLVIDSLPVNFAGHRSSATAVNGSVPGPTLRWREGDTVTLAVTNRLKKPTSIHWHGVRVPKIWTEFPG